MISQSFCKTRISKNIQLCIIKKESILSFFNTLCYTLSTYVRGWMYESRNLYTRM